MKASETNSNTESNFIEDIQSLEQKRLLDLSFLQKLSEPYNVRVALYIRVSTILQAGKDKVSIQEQEAQARTYAESNNWMIVKTYVDKGFSGTNIDDRAAFKEMIEDAKAQEFDVILPWSTDRLARNVDEMTAIRAELKRYNIQVASVSEHIPVVDPRIFNQKNESLNDLLNYLMDWKAVEDNKSRTNRFELGKMGKAKKGKIPVKVPYGYRKVIQFENGDPKQKQETDVVVENEAIVVKEIFDLYDKKSWGIKRIAEYLSLKNIPSPTGKNWCYSTVKYTLQNPTYTGVVRFGWRLSKSKESRRRLNQGHEGIITPGLHEKIIEPEQYKRVQEKMAVKHKMGGRAASSKGLLSGILKCGRCGGGTYITGFPNWFAYKKTPQERVKHKESQVYLCSKYAAYGRAGCSKRYVIYAERLHKIVIDKITQLANSETARKAFVSQMKKSNTKILKERVNSLRKVLGLLEEKHKRIKLAYTTGALPLEEFSEDIKALNEEKRAYLIAEEEAQVKLLSEEKVAQRSEETLLALADFSKSWTSANFIDKKSLLHSILEKIVVKENDIKIFFQQN